MDDWTALKKHLYYVDGALLDIYVLKADQSIWKKWVDTVNENYSVEFYNGRTGSTEEKIDFEAVQDSWNGKLDDFVQATIRVGNLKCNCLFFIESEIENDIDPREVNSMEDHIALMDYFKVVSKALDRSVILTPENTEDMVLIECRQGKITMPNNH